MKNWIKKNFLAICTTCLALDAFIPMPVKSLFFLGEPEFPYED